MALIFIFATLFLINLNKMKYSLASLFATLSLTFVEAQDFMTRPQDSVITLKEAVISADLLFGSKFQAKNRTGAAYYISPEELKQFGYTDINRVLRAVPGVNVYEEDGFGLRPNISLRGTSPERSSKITIMEDGVLIAPAPYSAPAAYYFPNVGRMHAVEVLKGSSQIQYGPYTTGGAINLISGRIPDTFSGGLRTSYGTFNSSNLHAQVGDSKTNIGYFVEYLNYRSDGFKDLDNGGDTGFNKNDFVAKFRLSTNPKAKLRQALDLKFQYAEEDGDETYLGLTQGDFNATPYRRYTASQKDNIKTDHIQFAATHTLDFHEFFRITTTGYYNGFDRNWARLSDVILDGTTTGISNILNDPSQFAAQLAILRGDVDAAGNSLRYTQNNRSYISKGIQTKLDYHWGDTVFHDIELSLRYHYDQEDRFQWRDFYGITNGIMQLNSAGTPGTSANRLDDATAFAAHALYKIKFNDLTIIPGIRYENIELSRKNYGTNDVTRSGSNISSRENKIDVFIPGIGFNYNINNKISLFGGVHKGFAPPSNTPDQEAEKSINYELGTRFSSGGLSGELIGFYNDYSNLLGSDFASSGGESTLDQFNAGEVRIKGLELLLNYNLLHNRISGFTLPITFAYTYTDTEFINSFSSSAGLWGDVTAGDELPYIAKHQINGTLALEHKKFELALSARYQDALRTLAGSGSIPENERLDSFVVVDFSAKYHVSPLLSLTGNVINLLDETYASARVPAGLRPGHPFGIYGGFNLHF